MTSRSGSERTLAALHHHADQIDMSGVRERKRKMVRGINDMYLENYKNTGAEFILGTGIRSVSQRCMNVLRRQIGVRLKKRLLVGALSHLSND